jgi:hypothetical protein
MLSTMIALGGHGSRRSSTDKIADTIAAAGADGQLVIARTLSPPEQVPFDWSSDAGTESVCVHQRLNRNPATR